MANLTSLNKLPNNGVFIAAEYEYELKYWSWWLYFSSRQGFWYFTEKKAKFCGIFRGKFAEKSADFAGFSREKSQNLRKNRSISRDFRRRKVKIRRKIGRFRGLLAEKSQISKDFQRQIRRKISQFHGKVWGKLHQETISKKQPISLDFFGRFRYNRSIFRRYDQRCLTFF